MASLRSQVGHLVRHHRERARLTQSELADRINRSPQLIGRIERGTAAPSFETLEALSAALNTPVRDFFGVGQLEAKSGPEDALVRLLERGAGLDQPDLEWLDRLVSVALSRRAPRS
jgi:transcriptional regulator with XRE-family HTH domain